MTLPGIVAVIGPGGLRGTIDTATWPLDGSRADVLVQFENAAPVLVPFGTLEQQHDGSYHLHLDPARLEHRDMGSKPDEHVLVVPVIEETLDVGTQPVETGRIRLRKVVHEREVLVDPPLLREEVIVERVSVNRIVDGQVSARTEGDTLIIPVLEEVLVVEKRLLLKEEVRLTKQRVEIHMPQRVTLRREEAVIERVDREDDDENPHSKEHHHGEDSHWSV